MKVGIWGVGGYSGEELCRLLAKNNFYEVVFTAGTSKQSGYPDEVEAAFLALPHEVSMRLVPGLLKKGVKVVDLSGAFRFKDPAIYDRWYGFHHEFPELLGEAVYGLPELNREKIKRASLIANPGCYATAINLALLPLSEKGLLKGLKRIEIKAVSGYSGGGRKAVAPLDITPYKCGQDGREHQHVPEIEMVLGLSEQVHFFPKVAPRLRGIEVSIKLGLPPSFVEESYRNRYWWEKFIKICSMGCLDVKEAEGTNYCYLAAGGSKEVEIGAVIDNLGKGAAGQAIQNMNLMCGCPEQLV
jgi:N-acetyl-gamma-glutamyl-phosphate reductase